MKTLEERIAEIKDAALRHHDLPHLPLAFGIIKELQAENKELLKENLSLIVKNADFEASQQFLTARLAELKAENEKLKEKLEDNFRCKHDYCLQKRGENSCGTISEYECSICGEKTMTIKR